MDFISSIKDERVIFARSLTSASGRKEAQACLIEGVQQLEWALARGVAITHVFYCSGSFENALVARLEQQSISCSSVTDGVMKKITDTNSVVPLIAIAPIENVHHNEVPHADFVVVADRLQDHGNIGTIMRTAQGFGIKEIVVTETSTDWFYKRIIEASRGSIFSTQLYTYSSDKEAIAKLKEAGYQIVVTSPHAKTLQSMVKLENKPVAVVVGNESDGVSQVCLDMADVVIKIPLYDTMESLNVAIFTGISLYELTIKAVLAMLTKKIFDTLGRNIAVVSKLLQMLFDSALQTVTDLHSPQVIFLMVLHCDKTMSYADITRDFGVANEDLDSFLNPLFSQKFIEKKSDEVVIIAGGEEFLAKIWIVVENAHAQALAGFSDDEAEQLNDFLNRIQKNCESILEKHPARIEL